ncbi:NAD(P)-binding protein [Myriangium duriaei CBS 260.36]|uniref:NAD(P)-binding protein n=1 Tax=Myriangium duriaei CBS 260.36 TaxID=1168546 RepID=A0A9P4MIB6_9PEZI|nr:NAD(P)-binding protein [Myriangium duriaei CBS 260.36]
MPYSLKDRKVLITGGSRGLGAVIARTFAAEGCHIAINYSSNATAANDLASELETKHRVRAITLQADAGSSSAIETLVQDTASQLGGLDILIANAGYTSFSDFSDLHALPETEWDRCWAVNVKGPLALLRAAMPHFNANAEGGAMIITSSIAGSSIGGSSMAYSVTKAAQLHLMKCLAKTQGSKVRVNAVLPGLLLTEWGLQYGEERIAALKDAAALKRDVDLQDCADVFVMLAKNTSITGQRVQIDSGLNIQNL